MRYKRIVSGLLACAMVVTSVFAGNVSTVKAEGAELPAPVASYDFNGSLGEGDAAGKAVVKGLGDYTGEVVYEDGLAQGDKAVKLGSHGIKLPITNLGTEYSISVWMKPDGTLAENQSVLFLGYHNPEKWVGVAGAKSGKVKIWTRDPATQDYNGWITVQETTISGGEWTLMTLTQSGEDLTVYKNGQVVGEGSGKAAEALNGENQSIWIGVTNWDTPFAGLVDDVKVYDTVLTAEQIASLYPTPAEMFEMQGITATKELELLEEGTGTIRVTVPSVVSEPVVNFVSEDPAIATVDAEGKVTAVKAGTTKVTSSVTFEGITKTAETAVTVKKNEIVNKELAVEYDLSGAVDGKLLDKSGNGNHATIHNPATVTFTKEDDVDVMNITDAASYLDLPLSIMDSLSNQEEFTIEATYARSNNAGGTSWLFNFGSIPKGTGTNYLFYCPWFSFGGNEVRAGIKDNNEEKLFTTGLVNQNEKFYTVNMVFDKGTIKLYLDGVKIGGQVDSGYSIMDDVVNPGTQDGILGYIGKSCWSQDTNFVGKISRFKIYNKAMTDEDVQLSDESYQQKFEAGFNEWLTEDQVKGQNASLSEVLYNLALPSAYNEVDITWKSSKEDSISNTGMVSNGSQDQKVTLTATVISGALKAEKSFEITVKALDRSALDAKLAEAQEKYENPYLSDVSKSTLKKAMDRAAAVKSQSEVATAINALDKAMSKLDFSELYKDPFSAIDDSGLGTTMTVAPKATQAMKLAIPDSIKDMVKVTYSSSDDKIASVSSTGVVTGKAIGYARVTATVTAAYDNFAMEYQTLVKVDFSMSSVKAAAKAKTLAKGKTTTISLTVPSSIKKMGSTVSYRATGAVSVNKNGKVTAKKAGTGKVYVKVSAAGKSITRTVTIKVGEITGNSSVKVNKSISLKVKGISGRVKWSLDSKGKKLATISASGKLKAKKKAGKVTVTAKVGSVTMTKTITIKK